MTLDDTVYQAELHDAEAKQLLAEQSNARETELFSRKIASESAKDIAVSNLEFANQLRAQGHPIGEAVISSATLRLRPILMTTGAMVLGAVPLALATGAGAESRQDIGWVIVGGLLVGTLFTLFVIPVVYTYLASRKPTARARLAEEEALQAAIKVPVGKPLEAAE